MSLPPSWVQQAAQTSKLMDRYKQVQYVCAVGLIASSIGLVTFQVIDIKDVAAGLLYYVAQAFLHAGSIFGLSYYVDKLTQKRGESPGGDTGNALK